MLSSPLKKIHVNKRGPQIMPAQKDYDSHFIFNLQTLILKKFSSKLERSDNLAEKKIHSKDEVVKY